MKQKKRTTVKKNAMINEERQRNSRKRKAVKMAKADAIKKTQLTNQFNHQ